ncbi:MAG: hypothetical protein QM811_05610 [Pirellulales bacterium]
MAELERKRFDQTDVDYLRETTWLRFIAERLTRNVKADDKATRDAAVAEALFAWTVRNVALESPSWGKSADPWAIPADAFENLFTPYVTLYLGRAGAAARGWVALELARQAGLRGVVLCVPDSTRPKASAPGASASSFRCRPARKHPRRSSICCYSIRAWDCLCRVKSRGKRCGCRNCTAKPELLRRHDTPNAPYPIATDDVAKLSALAVVSPSGWSKRMARLQHDLPGVKQNQKNRDAIVRVSEATGGPTDWSETGAALGFPEIGVWRHPFVVTQTRANPNDAQLRTMQIRTAIYEVELPLPKEGGGKKRMDEASDLVFDEATGSFGARRHEAAADVAGAESAGFRKRRDPAISSRERVRGRS